MSIDQSVHDFELHNGIPTIDGKMLYCRKLDYHADVNSEGLAVLTVELYVKPLETASSEDTK